MLLKYLPGNGTVLEVASGSGEHAVTFQKLLPKHTWQATDTSLVCCRSIRSWIKYYELEEIMPEPIQLDVETKSWPLTKEILDSLCAIVCINMIHISPWECSRALIRQAGGILKVNRPLILYGPFQMNHEPMTQSNMLFDMSLRKQNPSWGIRKLEDLDELAFSQGFKKEAIIQMPANNLSIIYIKV